jgi:hypothetical protein
MYIITIDGKEEAGAYSVSNEDGDHVLYIFEEEDDAMRFAMMLEEQRGYPTMNVIEVDDDTIIAACKQHGYEYSVFTEYDFVIPPEEDNDFI